MRPKFHISLTIFLLTTPLSGCGFIEFIQFNNMMTSDEGLETTPLPAHQVDPVMVKIIAAAFCKEGLASINARYFREFAHAYTGQPLHFDVTRSDPYSFTAALTDLSPDGACGPVIDCLTPLAMVEIRKGGFPYAQFYRQFVLNETLSFRQDAELSLFSNQQVAHDIRSCAYIKKKQTQIDPIKQSNL